MIILSGLISCDRALDSLITNTFSPSRTLRAGNVSGILMGMLSKFFCSYKINYFQL